jgi:type II secretory pathway pseudopilin PulG
MTLMELVIAVTILAITAAVGGAAFVNIIDRQATIRAANSDVERAAALRETIRQWVLQGELMLQQGGVPRGGRGGTAAGQQLATVQPGSRAGGASGTTGVTAAASTGNEISVTTNAPNPLMAAAVRIRLFVDADPNTPEEGLAMEYQASNNTALWRRQLDPDVGDLVIELYDSRTRRWYESTQAAAIAPVALRIAMVPAEGRTLPRLLQAPLTIVFGEVWS